MTKTIKIPGPYHPITISPLQGRIIVRVAGRVIADSVRALSLTEASYPPVAYIPLADVESTLLQRSDHTSYCPYKGECSYYNIPLGGDTATNAVWAYETPHPAVSAIQGHVAFYASRVEAIEIMGG